MKPKLIIVSIAIAAMVTSAMAEEPDSVYIMPFAETHNTGRSGMKLKWSSDGENWEMLCDGRTVIRSDWGSWKTMINPCIERTADGEYLATWQIKADRFTLKQRVKISSYGKGRDILKRKNK